ncbi:hemolysin family protein [soil metagenome]
MSDTQRQVPAPVQSGGKAADQTSQPAGSPVETWLDKLRAAFGLKNTGNLREEIAEALAAEDEDGFSPEERTMLHNILRLREARVDDIMVPRADIEAVAIDTRLGDLLPAFLKSGHSRMPVFRETLDDPVGLVHIKDLMSHITQAAALPPRDDDSAPAPPGNLDFTRVDLSRSIATAGLVRNILFVPPSMPVAVLLATMKAMRMQMALVIDEYGGTDGLVSLEDAIEMVVGAIEDEHDDDNGPMVVPDGEDGFLADARADLDDVAKAIGSDLGAGEPGEEVDTIGGLVFALVGRIPVRGELIAAPNGYEFEILDADPRRIKRLRIRKRRTTPRPARPRPPKPATEPGGGGNTPAAAG